MGISTSSGQWPGQSFIRIAPPRILAETLATGASLAQEACGFSSNSCDWATARAHSLRAASAERSVRAEGKVLLIAELSHVAIIVDALDQDRVV
jgi:hypothetical protein